MSIKRHIPNILTMGNLLFGCLAIGAVFHLPQVYAYPIVGFLMMGSLLCDFLDGFIARAMGVSSRLGKELDSLADVVTFGVLPGVMVVKTMQSLIEPMTAGVMAGPGAIDTILLHPEFAQESYFWVFFPFIGFLIPLFAAYRLAMFNVDLSQVFAFRGLPTPANALFFLSVYMWVHAWIGEKLEAAYSAMDINSGQYELLEQLEVIPCFWKEAYILAGLTVLFSILMVSRIPLMALKGRNNSWKDNWHKFIFMGVSAVLVIIFQYRAAPFILLLYFLFSIPDYAIEKRLNPRKE